MSPVGFCERCHSRIYTPYAEHMDTCKPDPHPVSTSALLNEWPEFVAAIAGRLAKGADTYGDKSFGRDVFSVVDEIQQELLDVVGWGFILWRRLEKIKARCGTL